MTICLTVGLILDVTCTPQEINRELDHELWGDFHVSRENP